MHWSILRRLTPSRGEDSSDITRGEDEGVGLLCQLNLRIAESVPFARGGEQLRHLGTKFVQRQCQCGRDRSGLEGEIEVVDELIGEP